jgi:hypothetical protein|tara:strand:+ start:667 stop:1065 length:399 start_codon:yes stop_codon:yes gene_type:complete
MRTDLNQIDKRMDSKGSDDAVKNELKLAVDTEKLEFDALNDILDTLMDEFKKEAKPDTSFLDWLKSKDDDYFKRLKYESGGPVDNKPKGPGEVKEIDLMQMQNRLGETLLNMSKAEREVVLDLLKRSGLLKN